MNNLIQDQGAVVVLASGGIESAVLLGRLRDECRLVIPVYVRFGLTWEEVEERYLRRYLDAISHPHLAPLRTFDMPVADIYRQDHFSVSGRNVPDAHTPDEAVYLPGRNLLLASKVAVWCALQGNIHAICVGTLGTNPFADASAEFFALLSQVCSMALSHPISIKRPLAGLHKHEVIRLGSSLPLPLTFSCINPVATDEGFIHCGHCNKCAERRRAFQRSGHTDHTVYARTSCLCPS